MCIRDSIYPQSIFRLGLPLIGFGRAFDRLCLSIRPIAPRASRSIVGSTSDCSCSFSYRVPPRGLDLRLPAFRFSGTRGAHTSRRAEARRALGEGSRPRALVSSSCAALPRSRRERRAPRVANARKTLASVFALFLCGKGIDFPKGTRTPRARVSVPRARREARSDRAPTAALSLIHI